MCNREDKSGLSLLLLVGLFKISVFVQCLDSAVATVWPELFYNFLVKLDELPVDRRLVWDRSEGWLAERLPGCQLPGAAVQLPYLQLLVSAAGFFGGCVRDLQVFFHSWNLMVGSGELQCGGRDKNSYGETRRVKLPFRLQQAALECFFCETFPWLPICLKLKTLLSLRNLRTLIHWHLWNASNLQSRTSLSSGRMMYLPKEIHIKNKPVY